MKTEPNSQKAIWWLLCRKHFHGWCFVWETPPAATPMDEPTRSARHVAPHFCDAVLTWRGRATISGKKIHVHQWIREEFVFLFFPSYFNNFLVEWMVDFRCLTSSVMSVSHHNLRICGNHLLSLLRHRWTIFSLLFSIPGSKHTTEDLPGADCCLSVIDFRDSQSLRRQFFDEKARRAVEELRKRQL